MRRHFLYVLRVIEKRGVVREMMPLRVAGVDRSFVPFFFFLFLSLSRFFVAERIGERISPG